MRRTRTRRRRRTARAVSSVARPCPRGRRAWECVGWVSRGPRREVRDGPLGAARRNGRARRRSVVPRHRPSSPEDSCGPVPRGCATRGCRQVFGLGTRSEKRAKRSERYGVTRFSLFFARFSFLLPGSLPRHTAQCHDPFVSHTAAGQRRLRTPPRVLAVASLPTSLFSRSQDRHRRAQHSVVMRFRQRDMW
ncbi:hypothetical protein LG3211_1010 [Lysobacter gummosus]|nr:hypothetical protein LG3211_1010 [Lysobacter gummosus]